MQGIFRTVVLSVTGLVILAMAALGFFLATFDPNQYLDQIGAAVKKATGKELRLEAPVEVALFPQPGIKTGRALLLDDPAFGPEPLLSVESASLAIALEPLFDGVLAIEDVSVSGARLKLVRDLDGRGNWEPASGTKAKQPDPGVTPLPPPDAAASGKSAPGSGAGASASKTDASRKRFEARIDGISVTDLAVSYHDEAGGASFSAAVDKLELRNVNPGADIPLRLSGSLRDDLSGRRGEFACDALARFSTAGDVSARVTSLRLALEGFAETPLVLEGAAEIAYAKAPEHLAVSGFAASLSLEQRRAALEGDLTWRAAGPDGEAASLTGALRFGDLDVDGWLATLRNPLPDEDATALKGAPNMTKPKVARHRTPAPDAQAEQADAGGRPAKGQGPPAGLPDAQIALSAASLTIEGLPLRQVSATVTVANNKADIPYSCRLYDGAIEGRFKAEADGKTVSAALVSSVKNLDLGKATAARGGTYSVTGMLDASLDVAGKGSDAQAVLHSLKGKMAAKAKGGEIRGFTLIPPDLRGLQPVPVNFAYTSMSASAVITDGTANSRDISLVSKTLTGRGGGIVRLAFKQLDIGVDFMLAGLPPAVPVAISGPFNSLSTSIDMRTFLRNVAETGVNAPADAAKGVIRGVGDLLFR